METNNQLINNEEIDSSKKVLEEKPSEDTNLEEELQEIKNYTADEFAASIEAILFSIGESISIDRLTKAMAMEEETLKFMMTELMASYNNADRGIRIIELEDSYQLCTKNEYYDLLKRVVNTPKKHNLTDVLLETLSIIAYKQPITRPEIEAIRGVSCVHAINKLVEYNLINEVGRLDAPGKPILFGTTEDFLRCFGVASTDALPLISQDKIADFKEEAAKEAEFTMGVDVSEEIE